MSSLVPTDAVACPLTSPAECTAAGATRRPPGGTSRPRRPCASCEQRSRCGSTSSTARRLPWLPPRPALRQRQQSRGIRTGQAVAAAMSALLRAVGRPRVQDAAATAEVSQGQCGSGASCCAARPAAGVRRRWLQAVASRPPSLCQPANSATSEQIRLAKPARPTQQLTLERLAARALLPRPPAALACPSAAEQLLTAPRAAETAAREVTAVLRMQPAPAAAGALPWRDGGVQAGLVAAAGALSSSRQQGQWRRSARVQAAGARGRWQRRLKSWRSAVACCRRARVCWPLSVQAAGDGSGPLSTSLPSLPQHAAGAAGDC